MRTRLYLVRHGEATGNHEGRFQGHFDAELTDRGMKQLVALGERFKDIPIDAAYSSDLTRARITCEYAVRHSAVDIALDERLREINCGDWENLEVKEAAKKHPEEFFKFKYRADLFKMPGGESFIEVQKRMAAAMDEIILNNSGKTVMVASHGGSIRVYLCQKLLIPLSEVERVGPISNTSVSIIDFDDKMNHDVIAVNNIDHLGEDLKGHIENRRK